MTPADLASALAALNMTPTQLAAHVGKHERTVKRWLAGGFAIPLLVEREVAFLLSEQARGAKSEL